MKRVISEHFRGWVGAADPYTNWRLLNFDVCCQVVLLRTNVTGFRDSLCDTQPVGELTESDEIFAVEVPLVCSGDALTAVVVNIDTSSSLRYCSFLSHHTHVIATGSTHTRLAKSLFPFPSHFQPTPMTTSTRSPPNCSPTDDITNQTE